MSISNSPFDVKKSNYLGSKIEPNKLVGECQSWDETEIIARQKLLASFAVEIWKK